MTEIHVTHTSPLLEARGVSARGANRIILDRVDLSIDPGEVVTLIGPNGAGKTTFLKILLGIIAPDRGTVRRKPGLRVGYVPQRMPIDPVLPLRVVRLLSLNTGASPERIRSVLAETGVGHLRQAPVRTLSGGEFQRVLLARAMLGDPEILVLDEPVQGVDFAGEAELYRLIGDLRARHGLSILMVSHDLHVVMRATDRVVCLNRHVCCTGAPQLVRNHPEFARLFGDHAVQALALYQHHHQCDDTGHHPERVAESGQ